MSDSYAVDAAYYDLIHAHIDDDIGLWQSFAGRTDHPVLEVGAGTGRIALALARAGYEVSGIDPSAAMLAIARQKADDAALDVRLYEGTATDLLLDAEHYGMVLLPADVFLYCADGEEQVATLKALAGALHFNGTLIIDLPGPALSLDPVTNGQPLLTWSGPGPDGQALDQWQVHEDDLAAQTRWLRVTYETAATDGTVRRFSSEHELRYVYRFEIEYLLRLAGLRLADIYGDYELGALTNDSARMIVVARRTQG